MSTLALAAVASTRPGTLVLLPESNQALVVLINVGNFFEITRVNEVMSRIPVGLLRHESLLPGLGMTGSYGLFNVIVLGIIPMQLWFLARVARKHSTMATAIQERIKPPLWTSSQPHQGHTVYPMRMTDPPAHSSSPPNNTMAS